MSELDALAHFWDVTPRPVGHHPRPAGRGDVSETIETLARAAYERRSAALRDSHLRPWELLPERARQMQVDDFYAARADALDEAAKAICSGCAKGLPVVRHGIDRHVMKGGGNTLPCHAAAIRALKDVP